MRDQQIPDNASSLSLRARLQRTIVVGGNASGKSTLARLLGAYLEAPVVELDDLFWKPNWERVSDAEFCDSLTAHVSKESWVVDGNYLGLAGSIAWPNATCVVWLDLPRHLLLGRLIKRTAGRIIRRDRLWAGNRETLARAIRPETSIIAYALRSHEKKRRACIETKTRFLRPESQFVRLSTPADVDTFVATLSGR